MPDGGRTDGEKTAFIAGGLAALRRFSPQALGMVRQGVTTGARMGRRALSGVGGVPQLKSEMLNQARMGGGIGALAGGALGALSAEEGHRGEGALKGALGGAASGALGGALSGAVFTGARGLRHHALTALAPGADMGARRAAATEALNRGWLRGMPDMAFGGPAGRGGAAFETLAAPATVAADMYLGHKLMGALPEALGGAPAEPPGPAKVAAEETDGPLSFSARLHPAALAAPLGALAGRVGAEELLERHADPRIAMGGDWARRMPAKGHLRKRILPGLASIVAGGLTYGGLNALSPEPESPEQKALKEIDLDTLKAVLPKQGAPGGPV